MQNHHPKPVEDYMTANMILIFINALWIFVVIWSFWGLGPVILLAMGLNHLITRLEQVKRAQDGGP